MNQADGAKEEDQISSPETRESGEFVDKKKNSGEFGNTASKNETSSQEMAQSSEEEEEPDTTTPHLLFGGHMSANNRSEGEFIDEKRNSGEFGHEKKTTKEPMEEFLGSSSEEEEEELMSNVTYKYEEVGNDRAIKCARRLNRRG